MLTEPLSTYDEMPYVRGAFPQTHPDRLATLAKLFGMTPPVLENCRVLELGCASGDNLIPMALGLPNAQFIGIDLSRRQIELGQQTAITLKLKNIDLRQCSIADVDPSFGQFDYVICHGVYSWAPEHIREKILAICKENLRSNGVAYVSYNTLPGWRTRGMIRDMMIYHSRSFSGATAKVTQARALLDFLAQSVPAATPYGMILRQELDKIRNQPDAYLFHDHLEEVNEPVYFHQFAASAQQHGLQYLAEAEFSEMLVANFPPQVAATLRRVAPDLVRMEQYMDFVRNRSFRQTLVTHEDVILDRHLHWQALRGFYVASLAQPQSPQPSLTHGLTELFHAPNGATLTTSNSITKAAMLLLRKQWPLGLPFEQLVVAARASIAGGADVLPDADVQASDAAILGDELLQCYTVDLVELRIRSPRLSLIPSARPMASPLARLQAALGDNVTNLRHESVQLNVLPRELLCLLDGTRDRDELVAALSRLAPEGGWNARDQPSDKSLTDDQILAKNLRTTLDELLPVFAKAALLVD